MSLYHILEQLILPNLVPGQPSVPTQFRVTSVWMRDGESPDQEYEFRLLLTLPPGNNEVEVMKRTFYFNMPIRRFIWDAIIAELDGPGLLTVHSAIRPAGGTDWMIQTYSVMLVPSESSPESQS
ncbi:MAG: hypothetical protein ACLQGP_39520 [Isosphaeraceae bacterium]